MYWHKQGMGTCNVISCYTLKIENKVYENDMPWLTSAGLLYTVSK